MPLAESTRPEEGRRAEEKREEKQTALMVIMAGTDGREERG